MVRGIEIFCSWVTSVAGGCLWRFFFFKQTQSRQKHIHSRQINTPTLTPNPTTGPRLIVSAPSLTSGDRPEKENRKCDPVISNQLETYE